MAIPQIIELKPLQNQYQDGTFTPEDPNQVSGIVVDSDAEKTLGAIHKENFAKVIFELINQGANPADIFFYGAAIDDIVGTDDPHNPPPDDTSNEWFALPNGTVPGLITNDARIITDNWTWLMIRIARTNAGLSTTLDIRIRGK